jgi:hypothetical protein
MVRNTSALFHFNFCLKLQYKYQIALLHLLNNSVSNYKKNAGPFSKYAEEYVNFDILYLCAHPPSNAEVMNE